MDVMCKNLPPKAKICTFQEVSVTVIFIRFNQQSSAQLASQTSFVFHHNGRYLILPLVNSVMSYQIVS